MARRARLFFEKFETTGKIFYFKFGTTGKIILRQIWKDGKDSLTKNWRDGQDFLKTISDDGQDFFTLYPICLVPFLGENTFFDKTRRDETRPDAIKVAQL